MSQKNLGLAELVLPSESTGRQDLESALGDLDIGCDWQLKCLDLRLEQRPPASSHRSECKREYENQ